MSRVSQIRGKGVPGRGERMCEGFGTGEGLSHSRSTEGVGIGWSPRGRAESRQWLILVQPLRLEGGVWKARLNGWEVQ